MLEDLTERVGKLIEGKDPFGFNVKFNLGDTGLIHVAGQSSPMSVTNDDGEAETTFRISGDDLSSMLNGDLNAMNAYMGGKLVVEGDLAGLEFEPWRQSYVAEAGKKNFLPKFNEFMN